MATSREPWMIRPAKKKKPVPPSIKSEVEAKAQELIEKVLNPLHVKQSSANERFNYITDIQADWFRGDFYFISTYACPSPDALYPSFESKFARLEHLGSGKFAMYFMRCTGKEWVGIFDNLTVDECMNSIRDESWFHP